MANPHRVVEGEHLLSIAEKEKYRGNWAEIWTHPKNASLEKSGRTPWVLNPDDAITIPLVTEKISPAQVTQIHNFKIKTTPLKLRVKLLTTKDQGQTFDTGTLKIEEENQVHTLASKADGLYETPDGKPLAVRATNATLKYQRTEPDGGKSEREIRMKIAFLRPHTVRSGQMQRLNSLGYNAGFVSDDKSKLAPDQQRQFNSAVEEFECDQKLTLTGVRPDGSLHTATTNKLKEVYGC